MSEPTNGSTTSARLRRHLRLGWWSLLAFLLMGIGLEALHGFKVGLYLDHSNATRRLMWTLAHAHGTMLSLLNILFALALGKRAGVMSRGLELASRSLCGGTLLLPAGFFLGGLGAHGNDSGPGVILVAPGALLLLLAVWLTAANED